jgi:glycine dehydrogenase
MHANGSSAHTTASPTGTTANSTHSATGFEARHIAPNADQIQAMLSQMGAASVEELITQTVPAQIRRTTPMELEGLPEAMSEQQLLAHMASLAAENKVVRSLIGMGYYGTFTPPVILRNILENPGWYTAYTPYQAEIAQGRLEMLLNYQTLVCDLTGMPIANASLLDEATAAAEAMAMLFAHRSEQRKTATTFFVADTCFPQTLDVLFTRAAPLNITIQVAPLADLDLTDPTLYGILVQYPDAFGHVGDIAPLLATARAEGVNTCVATDLLALTLLTPPGSFGADCVVGSAQRFGVPMGYGGPHAAFFACREEHKRNMPGRIIGASIDAEGNFALRMALQTREQHIRREKATSNICTAQVLLSVMAAAYAIYHGPTGLKAIATRIHNMAGKLAMGLSAQGYALKSGSFFDTLFIVTPFKAHILEAALEAGFNLNGHLPDGIGIALDELTTEAELADIMAVFARFAPEAAHATTATPLSKLRERNEPYLTHPTFSAYHAEHEMLRYLKRLENKDLSLAHSMIALGSCTMKLNATAEMMPLSMAGFAHIHPFAPASQAKGYHHMFERLSSWLCEVTGFAAVSLQPNSGAQGEYAGLMAIRAYHHAHGNPHRNVALIPQSAHGTNPASAVMAGFKVVVTKTDERGNVDMEDLALKVEQHADQLGALMVTYPSTHGVFETSIKEICALIHQNGGLVYMDGANMNAQVGLTSPGLIGADVCHLNLHKTFCIPHGGGGPGMGPIGVVAHLAPFLAGHALIDNGVGQQATTAISAAPFGSASILTISYAYICMMAGSGLTRATEVAIVSANYLKARLEPHFNILYTGENGRCAHEFILDLRPFKQHGIEAEDLAKRLMDYGYHAPTLSFPVAGTLMIEPTESESLFELDRFCQAMISIRAEIEEVITGQASRSENVLKMAPHTAATITADDWNRPYSRSKAAYPLSYTRASKFWPTVARIDSAYGDRNLVCTCPPIEEYAMAQGMESTVEVG